MRKWVVGQSSLATEVATEHSVDTEVEVRACLGALSVVGGQIFRPVSGTDPLPESSIFRQFELASPGKLAQPVAGKTDSLIVSGRRINSIPIVGEHT
jgi:hypothetical protein